MVSLRAHQKIRSTAYSATSIVLYGRLRNTPDTNQDQISSKGELEKNTRLLYVNDVPKVQKRRTQWINRKPAANLHHATRYAERINLPLNMFVTINFSQIGIDPESSSEVFQKVVGQRFAPWLRRTADNAQSVPPTYVWTLEAANENQAVHWVVHIPNKIERHFRQALHRWVAELARGAPSPQALKIISVYNIKGTSLKEPSRTTHG